MCLILFSFQQHPVYKLVVAANRDEFFERKTAPAEYWHDHPDVVGGRDLEAGGTWMGMTRKGKLAMITNYRDPLHIRASAPSRGKLVSDYLTSNEPAFEYLKSLQPTATQYNGYNLLAGNAGEVCYFSNYQEGVHRVQPGLHGLSNHLLESLWPKVVRGKEKLSVLLGQEHVEAEQLFELLYDEKRGEDSLLPDTGIGLERERALSSMFIKTPNYGTRCSTVVLVDHKDHTFFAERVYDLQTYQFSTRVFEF